MAKDGRVVDGLRAVEMQGSYIMKPWQFAVVGLALLATAGCRSDPAVAILERQLRLQEDEIYRLRAPSETCRIAPVVRRAARPARRDRATRSRDDGGVAPAATVRARRDSTPPPIELPSQPSTRSARHVEAAAPARCPPTFPTCPKNLQRPVEADRPRAWTARSLERAAGEVSSPAARASRLASQSASAVPFTPSGDSRRVAAHRAEPHAHRRHQRRRPLRAIRDCWWSSSRATARDERSMPRPT